MQAASVHMVKGGHLGVFWLLVHLTIWDYHVKGTELSSFVVVI